MTDKKSTAKEGRLVTLVRSTSDYPPPHRAEVPTKAVEEWLAAGWEKEQ